MIDSTEMQHSHRFKPLGGGSHSSTRGLCTKDKGCEGCAPTAGTYLARCTMVSLDFDNLATWELHDLNDES